MQVLGYMHVLSLSATSVTDVLRISMNSHKDFYEKSFVALSSFLNDTNATQIDISSTE